MTMDEFIYLLGVFNDVLSGIEDGHFDDCSAEDRQDAFAAVRDAGLTFAAKASPMPITLISDAA